MSDYVTVHNSYLESVLLKNRDAASLRRVALRHKGACERKARSPFSFDETATSLFKTVRPNIVQSIRAFRVADLAEEAGRLKQHFLYTSCAAAQTKAAVLETIVSAFLLPQSAGKNYESLYKSLTELIDKAGPQPGFVIVLEALPATPKFDKEARESLLDVFRDAAEFWADRQVQFRAFFSFEQ
ncbi:putative barstar (Ribonuclease inhibitor) [Candidatus Glomeribacter gigasporarum BEG34]|uniref:Putative barstar (Ribonuclease inhibitor) n=1 Tax=Candidatus Glomeribacter gigasporarum BEG34 TaxID=1070319 RepID=G2JAG3_9BURK|nr:barstar family protein [Candidatus Glomeribacter gigasporarum]CCD29765.1 putative barstar (Ribonuclease inhibitor) [Candidatus Glomeribacter gigasporarum BEG34]